MTKLQAPLVPSDAGFDGPSIGGRVMVVDDSAGQRKLISSMLRRAGYDVVCAADGAEGLALLERHPISLVVCDWVMPGLSGPEFCAKIRSMDREGYLYIVMLTSNTERGATAHALDAGADDFLHKPVDSHDLRARVRAGARIVEMQQQLLAQNQRVSVALEELSALYDALDRDLLEAQRLQHALLPERLCEFDGASAGFLLRSSGKVGGDLVGHFPAGPGKLGAYSIDVSGHGVASALLTARLAGMFANGSPEENVAMTRDASGQVVARDPAQVAAEINRRLMDDVETELYLTLVVVILDLATGLGELVQAGHPHPILLTARGQARQLGGGGLPIGLVPGAEYDVVRFTMAPGDRLFLHSDGFSECPDPTGMMLGMRRLANLLKGVGDLGPDQALDRLAEGLQSFAQSDAFPDDLSGVIIDYFGQTPKS
ncbi:MAG: fused response regulator/phosphatase [Pseudomonadota bacterium]